MSFLTFIISQIASIYSMLLLLRVWMQWSRCDYYNPFAQFIVKVTQPVVKPFRRIIPAIGPIDTASIVVAFIILTAYRPIMLLLTGASIQGDLLIYLIIGVASLLKTTGSMIFWVLIIRAIMSWISQGRSPVDHLLYQLSEPLMAPVRRIIPTFGGLDFSVMIILFALTALNMLGYDILGPIWGML